MNLMSNPVWPKVLVARDAGALVRALKKQGLLIESLIASVSGTEDLIAWVRGICIDEEYEYDFEAIWFFDWDRLSTTAQYYLAELEIIE